MSSAPPTMTTSPEDRRLAGFWRRAVGALVDALLVGVLATAAEAAYLGSIGERIVDLTDPNQPLLIAGVALIAMIYDVAATRAWGGTLGKRAMGLRVEARDGGRPGIGQSLGRLLGRIVSALPALLGFLWAGWDRRKQTWHDKLADTVVVRDDVPAPRPVAGPVADEAGQDSERPVSGPFDVGQQGEQADAPPEPAPPQGPAAQLEPAAQPQPRPEPSAEALAQPTVPGAASDPWVVPGPWAPSAPPLQPAWPAQPMVPPSGSWATTPAVPAAAPGGLGPPPMPRNDANLVAISRAGLGHDAAVWLQQVAGQVDARLDRLSSTWRSSPHAEAARACTFGLLIGHLARLYPHMRPELHATAELHPSFSTLLEGSRLATLEQIAAEPGRMAAWLGPLVDVQDPTRFHGLLD